MEAFEKEQVPADMHVKAPNTLLEVVCATYGIHLFAYWSGVGRGKRVANILADVIRKTVGHR